MQARQAHLHRGERGSREGRGPAHAPDRTAAQHAAARTRCQPDAHIAPTARSEATKNNINNIYYKVHIFCCRETIQTLIKGNKTRSKKQRN